MSCPVSLDHSVQSNVGSSARGPTESPSQTEQARLQILWEDIMQHQTKFVHHEKVAVLMFSWDDTCDDLETKTEVDELGRSFRETYGFEVRQAKLNTDQRAHIQMVKHLAIFVSDFEDRNSHNLLIIYYAGHGWPKLPKDADQRQRELWLTGNVTEKTEKQNERNTIMWKEAEKIIKGAEADVFLIFDCCFAGLIGRAYEPKRFETLSACTADQTTNIPGKTSFTAALIWALKELHSRPFFNSSELRTKIMECPDFPKHQIPQLSERVPSLSHIVIAPSNSQPLHIPPEEREDASGPIRTSYIDLRLHLDKGDDEQISEVANLFKYLMKDHQLSTSRIDFLGKDSVWKSSRWRVAANYGNLWFELAKREKQRRLSRLEVDRPQLLAPIMPVSPATSAAVSEDLPEDLSVD